jgi:hypothetical protein
VNTEPEDTKLQFDFLPLTLSIETVGGEATPLIRRGTPLPAKRSRIFSTAADNQKSVEISILLGERPLAKNNIRIGSWTLGDIPPAPKEQPQIRVTFEVDKFCNVKVEAAEAQSGRKINVMSDKVPENLTNDTIQQMLREAEENREEDKARSVIISAELRIHKDQEQNSVTATTRKIEKLVADIGIALMESNEASMIRKTKELEALLTELEQTPSTFGFGDFGNIFDSFYKPKSARQKTYRRPAARPAEPKTKNSLVTVPTHTTAIVQVFLESIDPELEVKRAGAWEAIESNRPDARTQASHSMREVLRLLLDRLAPTEEVIRAPWYKKPKNGAPVTRAIRIRYALAGMSDVTSESTLSLVTDLAAAVDSMYAKLSAESHSDKQVTATATRMYLSACEAVIGLIASQRHS